MGKVTTDYLGEVFHRDLFQAMVKRAIDRAHKIMMDHPFEAIAFTGTSGSAIAYILGHTLDVPLMCIRKVSEDSHYKFWDNESQRSFEGYMGAKSYIIVDDFISSGKTAERIMQVIQDRCLDCKCVAMLMYAQSEEKRDYQVKNEELARYYRNSIPVYSCKKDKWDVQDP